MKTSLDEIKKKAIPILKKAGVTRSSIFGSYVRGEEKEGSDIDFLVELPSDKSLFDFVDLKQKLEDALDKKVDLVEYIMIKSRIKDSILKEQIPIL